MVLACQPHQPLQALHTMHFKATAAYYARINTPEELLRGLREIREFERVYWLGGGSNTIFLKDFDGLVVHVQTKGITVLEEDAQTVKVRVAAGENWHHWIQTCLSQGWYGLENLSLIPGTVGAAPIQNIGAYGAEVKDVISSVEVLEVSSGQQFCLDNNECKFKYRSSIFKNKKDWLVLAVVFSLHKQFTPQLSYQALKDWVAQMGGACKLSAQQLVNYIQHLRRARLPDPDSLGNSGSFFHNPIVSKEKFHELKERFRKLPWYAVEDKRYKIAASWLIDQLGLKGFTVGQMSVYQNQALVIVNQKNGTAEQLLRLMAIITDAVKHQYGICLTVEPNLV
ncbi:MAG: UDP-N-acetylmuramate dehydrogenase [Neisseriaceae bacterium]